MVKKLTGKRFEATTIPGQGGRLLAAGRVLTDQDLSTENIRGFMVNQEGVVNFNLGDQGDPITGLRVIPGILYPFFVTRFRTSPSTGAAEGIFIFS